MSYRRVKIGDICAVGDGAHTKLRRLEYGVLYLTSKNIRQGFLDLSKPDYISEDDYQKFFSNSKSSIRDLRAGDVLIGIIGTFGNCYMYKAADRFGISSSVAILRPDREQIIPDYLYYVISSEQFRSQIDSIKGGSAQGYTNLNTVKSISIPLPPMEIQKKIVPILSCLDEKIELNHRMNETLEQMAMALYKHWFVDFGPFQDENFVESELGSIPEGWEICPIGEAVQILGGGTPRTSVPEYWTDGNINWFTPTDLTSAKSMLISESSKKITMEGLHDSSAKLFPEFSVMMTSRATIGAISINRTPASTNQGFIVLVPNESFSLYQLYFWLKTNMEAILAISNGSTFMEVNRTNFKKMLIPRATRIEEYIRQSKYIFDEIDRLLLENETLNELRNLILPRLLSGKIDLTKEKERIQEVLCHGQTV